MNEAQNREPKRFAPNFKRHAVEHCPKKIFAATAI